MLKNKLPENIKKYLLFWPFVFVTFDSNAQSNSLSPSIFNSGSGGLNLNSRLSVTETWIKSNSTGINSRSGWTSDINPGISINKKSGAVKGNLDYSIHEISQPGNSGNSSQNSLNSSFLVEAISDIFFIDLNGVISQQTISAFGEQTTSSFIESNNRTEVSSLGFSPYVRGHLVNNINYELRYGSNSTRVKSLSSANSNQKSASLKINGASFFDKLRWSANLSKQEIDQNSGVIVDVENLNLSTIYSIANALNLSMTAGREIGNYSSAAKESSGTYGAGVSWAPSEATKFSINSEKRLLGNMHSLNFEHRTPRTNWMLSDVKSISTSNNQTLNSNTINTYNLYYNLYASIEPDALKRAELVRGIMQAQGIIGDSSVLNGYLSNGTTIQRIQAFSFALFGVRDTITLSLTKSLGSTINSTLISSSSIMQDGVSFGYSHKLTPDVMISTQLANQKSFDNVTLKSSDINSINVNLSSRVSEKTSATITARHTVARGGSSPYVETAVSGTLTVKF